MAVTVVCPQCEEHGRGRVEMTFKTEFDVSNLFECAKCGTFRHVTKDKTGGNVGSGRPSTQQAVGVGIGFGPGTATFRGRQ